MVRNLRTGQWLWNFASGENYSTKILISSRDIEQARLLEWALWRSNDVNTRPMDSCGT